MKQVINLLLLISFLFLFSFCGNIQEKEGRLISHLNAKIGWKKDAPIVMLLHGYGSNPNYFMQLHKRLSQKYNYISLEAPIVVQQNAYSWFGVEFDQGRVTDINQDELKYSLELLNSFIEGYKKEHGLTEEDIVLCGFSQGAVMGLELAIAYPKAVSGVIAISGTLGLDRQKNEKYSNNACIVDMLQIHGTLDKTVTPMDAERARKYFGDCPNYQFKVFETEHRVTDPMLNFAKRWLDYRLLRFE